MSFSVEDEIKCSSMPQLDFILVMKLSIDEDCSHSQKATIKHINIRTKIDGQFEKTGTVTVTRQLQRPSLPCLMDLSGGAIKTVSRVYPSAGSILK